MTSSKIPVLRTATGVPRSGGYFRYSTALAIPHCLGAGFQTSVVRIRVSKSVSAHKQEGFSDDDADYQRDHLRIRRSPTVNSTL